MKRTALLSLVMMVVVNFGILVGVFPPWTTVVTIGLALAMLFAICFHMAADAWRKCEICHAPLTDRRSASDYAVKYGVRVCGECGAKLDQRFQGECSPDDPPFPPFMA